MALMADQDHVAREVAEQLGVSLATLYTYVGGKGRPKARVELLLEKAKATRTATAMTPEAVNA